MRDCFCWFLAAMFVPLKGTPNIHKTLFFPNFLHIKFCTDVILGKAFCTIFTFFHFPHSGLSLFMVSIFIFDGVIVKTKNSYNVTTIILLKWGPYFQILIFCMHALLLQSKPMYILRVLWHHWLITCQSPCHVMCTCFPVMSYTWVCPGQFPSDITG